MITKCKLLSSDRRLAATIVFRRCTEHEELKTEVVALTELVRELKEKKMVRMDVEVQTGTQTEAGSVLGEDSGPGVLQTVTEMDVAGVLEVSMRETRGRRTRRKTVGY